MVLDVKLASVGIVRPATQQLARSEEFNVSRALESFQINGFVVLDNALSKLQLEDLRKASGFCRLRS